MSHDPTKLHVYSSTSTSQKKKKNIPKQDRLTRPYLFRTYRTEFPLGAAC